MPPRRLLIPFFVTSIVSTSSALAAGRIVVLAPQLKPPGAVELRDKFHDALVKGLSKAGGVVPADEVRSRLGSTPELLGCAGGACLNHAATLLGADRLVVPQIEDEGKSYTIRVSVYDAAGNELGRGPEERCDICTVREADRAVERAGERAVPVVLAAHSVPVAPPVHSAAKVSLMDEEDGPEQPRMAARTRSNPPPPPAEHRSRPVARTSPRRADPPPDPAPAAPRDDRPSLVPYRGLAIGAFVLAGGSLAATIAFGYYASKENETTCTGSKTNCPTIFKGNVAPAAVFGVATGLAAGAGALFLYLGWKQQHRDRPVVSAGPIPGGFAASASLEF